MSVTLKDVAALAGVSPSTASRVCKNHPSISRETKEKVRKAMEQLGYEPSTQSAEPEAVRRTIGIILPPSPKESFENSFHLEVIRGISQFSNQHGYINTVITGQDEDEILLALTNIAKADRSTAILSPTPNRMTRLLTIYTARGFCMLSLARRIVLRIRRSMWTMIMCLQDRKLRNICLQRGIPILHILAVTGI